MQKNEQIKKLGSFFTKPLKSLGNWKIPEKNKDITEYRKEKRPGKGVLEDALCDVLSLPSHVLHPPISAPNKRRDENTWKH